MFTSAHNEVASSSSSSSLVVFMLLLSGGRLLWPHQSGAPRDVYRPKLLLSSVVQLIINSKSASCTHRHTHAHSTQWALLRLLQSISPPAVRMWQRGLLFVCACVRARVRVDLTSQRPCASRTPRPDVLLCMFLLNPTKTLSRPSRDKLFSWLRQDDATKKQTWHLELRKTSAKAAMQEELALMQLACWLNVLAS